MSAPPDAEPSYTKLSEVPGFVLHAQRDRQAKAFQYRGPKKKMTGNRAFVPLVRSDSMIAMVQVIREGGEQQLHSHDELDGYWMVLKGRARFYGEGDVVIADLGPMDGIFIPKNFLYWFEAAGDEVLELLQVEAVDRTVRVRYNVPNPQPTVGEADIFTPDGTMIGAGLRME